MCLLQGQTFKPNKRSCTAYKVFEKARPRSRKPVEINYYNIYYFTSTPHIMGHEYEPPSSPCPTGIGNETLILQPGKIRFGGSDYKSDDYYDAGFHFFLDLDAARKVRDAVSRNNRVIVECKITDIRAEGIDGLTYPKKACVAMKYKMLREVE